MGSKPPTTVTRLDQREIEAKVRELQRLQLQSAHLAISTALERGHRFVELESAAGAYSIFVNSVVRAANEEPRVLKVRFHSYWSNGSGVLRSEGGRVTLTLEKPVVSR